MSGELVRCPSCGEEARQGAMIPVLGDGEKRYVCPPCAKEFSLNEFPAAPRVTGGGGH